MAVIKETGFERLFNIPLPPSSEKIQDDFSHEIEDQAILMSSPELIFTERKPTYPSFTIDGAHSKDLDDAIGVEKDGKGFIVHVSIADVSDVVFKNSFVDQEAARRSFTEYYGDTKNKPMIPRILSEDKMSLHQDQLRPTITTSIPINENGNVGEISIAKTVLKSVKRFNYDEADQIINNGVEGFGQVLKDCKTIAELLEERRKSRGANVVFDLEKGIATSEEGVVREIPEEEEYVANMIIREFMILTNEKVARYVSKNDIPALYRNHNPQIQTRGFYATDQMGHFGLGLSKEKPYLHFTSPIRRYPDLTVHRQISAFIQGDKLPYSKEELDEIAIEINLRQKQIKDREELKRQTGYKIAMNAIANDEYSTLSKPDLRRSVRVAINNGEMSSVLKNEVLERLRNNKLGVREMYMILLKGDKDIRNQLVDYIDENGDIFKDILMMTRHISDWSATSYNTIKTSEGYKTTAKVKIGENIFQSQEMSGETALTSERHAGVELIKLNLIPG